MTHQHAQAIYNTGAQRNFTHLSSFLKSFTSAHGAAQVAQVALGQVLHPLGERLPLGGNVMLSNLLARPSAHGTMAVALRWNRDTALEPIVKSPTRVHFHYLSAVRMGWRR